MPAFAIFLLVLAASSAIGALAYLWRRDKKHGLLLISITVILGIICFVASGYFFAAYALKYGSSEYSSVRPDSNIQILLFSSENVPVSLLDADSSRDLGENAHSPIALSHPNSTVSVRYQSRTRVNNDFLVDVDVKGMVPGTYRFIMQAPKTLELRPLDECSDKQNSNEACSSTSDDEISVRWHIAPSSASEILLALVMPENLRPATSIGKSWSGIVISNDQSKAYSVSNWMLRHVLKRNIDYTDRFKIDEGNPEINSQNYDIDMRKPEIQFRTEILVPLGISENAYIYMASIGSVLSSGLGSGWLIQVLNWLTGKLRDRPREDRLSSL